MVGIKSFESSIISQYSILCVATTFVKADLNAVLALQGISPGQNAHDAAIARWSSFSSSFFLKLLPQLKLCRVLDFVSQFFPPVFCSSKTLQGSRPGEWAGRCARWKEVEHHQHLVESRPKFIQKYNYLLDMTFHWDGLKHSVFKNSWWWFDQRIVECYTFPGFDPLSFWVWPLASILCASTNCLLDVKIYKRKATQLTHINCETNPVKFSSSWTVLWSTCSVYRNSWMKLVKSARVCRVNVWSTLKDSKVG